VSFKILKSKEFDLKKFQLQKILYLIQVIANNIEMDASNFLFACLIYSQIRLKLPMDDDKNYGYITRLTPKKT
jgi:hypothetical protein